MGYTVRPRVFRLVWPEEHRLHGMWIDVRACTWGEYKSIVRAVMDAPVRDKDMIETRWVLDHVHAWNLVSETGDPLPVSMDSLEMLETSDVRMIVVEYLTLCVSGTVPAPLEQPSRDGEQFPEALIPMETLSESQPN